MITAATTWAVDRRTLLVIRELTTAIRMNSLHDGETALLERYHVV